jgi:hypothetical protein
MASPRGQCFKKWRPSNVAMSSLVSHTTDDLVFEWLPEESIPLVVDEGIQFTHGRRNYKDTKL